MAEEENSRAAEKSIGGVRQRWQGKPMISMVELGKHKKDNDCWIAINGVVYDVSKFLTDHPGGLEVILNSAGGDASNEFDEISHSANARKMAEDFEVGILEGCEKTATGAAQHVRKNVQDLGVSGNVGTGFGWMPILIIAGIAVVAYAVLGSMQQ